MKIYNFGFILSFPWRMIHQSPPLAGRLFLLFLANMEKKKHVGIFVFLFKSDQMVWFWSQYHKAKLYPLRQFVIWVHRRDPLELILFLVNQKVTLCWDCSINYSITTFRFFSCNVCIWVVITPKRTFRTNLCHETVTGAVISISFLFPQPLLHYYCICDWHTSSNID